MFTRPQPGPGGTGRQWHLGRGCGAVVSGPAVGLWPFEPREFVDILAGVIPWLETFCEPVETKAGGAVDFWVRDSSALGPRAFDPADVGVFFPSEDEELPTEDEDYSAFSRPPVLLEKAL
ncbi:DUF6368 family protein [Streptomyces sp. NPDC002039]|uniref:DUF6368 family protein n=1 Tax=Streptomyces sp. NPDC002039 TaxID=3154660 RepID=UPI00332DBF8C